MGESESARRAARLALAVGVASFASACGAGGQTRRMEDTVEVLKGQIRDAQASIAAARDEGERLGQRLEAEADRVSALVDKHVGPGDQVHLSLDVELVSSVVRGLLDGYGGTVPASGARPAAVWELRGLRTRAARERMFISGSYNVRFGGGECDGPVHGHLIYLERNLLKLSDMEVRCRSQGQEVYIDVAGAVPAIPIPFEVVGTWPLTSPPHVGIKRERLDLVIPLQIDMGATRVTAGTRAVQVR